MIEDSRKRGSAQSPHANHSGDAYISRSRVHVVLCLLSSEITSIRLLRSGYNNVIIDKLSAHGCRLSSFYTLLVMYNRC